MAQVLLPFLSGTLEGVIDEVAKKGDPIAIEILKINSLIKDTISVYEYLPESLKVAVKAKLIDANLTGEVSMLSVRTGTNEPNISFLPKDKEPEYTDNGTWARRNRQEGKPGKIFQKALVKEFKQREWELFVNNFKAEVCQCNNFEIVSGEDIRKWYLDENYYECVGSLGNSCMRHESAQDFFDIYVDNAKMLITKKGGRLTGRAIVWEIDENTTLLDRIYTCFDYLENCFIDYAKEHKWIIRENNSLLHSGEEQRWLVPDDDYNCPRPIPMTIKLKSRYDQFPYVDSFRYYNDDKNTISTSFDKYCLDSTDGDYMRCSITCDNCGRVFYGYDEDGDLPDEMHYSEYADMYVCDDCSFYSEILEDYIPDSTVTVSIHTHYGHEDFPKDLLDEYLVTDPSQLTNRDTTIVEIDGEYYLYDDYLTKLVFNVDTQKYEIRSNSD